MRESKQDQRRAIQQLSGSLPMMRKTLRDVNTLNQECLQAGIEENDFTVVSYEDLEYEIGLLESNLRKKLSFIENRKHLGSSLERALLISDTARRDRLGRSVECDTCSIGGVAGYVAILRHRRLERALLDQHGWDAAHLALHRYLMGYNCSLPSPV